MGLDRHDLHGNAISFEFSFSDLFVLFCFVFQIILQSYVGKIKRSDRADCGFHISTYLSCNTQEMNEICLLSALTKKDGRFQES